MYNYSYYFLYLKNYFYYFDHLYKNHNLIILFLYFYLYYFLFFFIFIIIIFLRRTIKRKCCPLYWIDFLVLPFKSINLNWQYLITYDVYIGHWISFLDEGDNNVFFPEIKIKIIKYFFHLNLFFSDDCLLYDEAYYIFVLD